MTATVIRQLPASVDLFVYPGDDLTLTFDWSIDLTGYTLHATTTPSGATPVVLTVTVTNASAGQHTITVPAAVTAAVVSPQTWKFWWVTPASKTLTPLAGQVIVRD